MPPAKTRLFVGRPALLALALAFGGVLLSPVVADAHAQFAVATINRYTRLALLPHGQVRLLYTVMVGDIPAFEMLRRADVDDDGHVSQTEGAAMTAKVRERVQKGVELQIDGQPVPLSFEEPTWTAPDDAVSLRSFSIDLSALISLPPLSENRLRYDDHAQLDPVGEVEVVIENSIGTALSEVYQGAQRLPGDPAVRLRFQFFGPVPSSLTDRSVTLRFQAKVPPRRSWPSGLLATGATGGLLAVVWFWQRRRRARGIIGG